MNDSADYRTTRREFLRTTTFASASALGAAALQLPVSAFAHAAGSDVIQIGLVGCGGRGTGAASDAMTAEGGPVKLAAMADVFEDRLNGSAEALKEKCTVTPEHKFIGFDGYRKVMDLLKPGDVVILTTPLAFRWVHYAYAIEKGLNVFMEKPLTADGPTSKRMLDLNKKAEAKNLKVGVGLMSRHHRPLQELHKRVEDGEIGDILLMRGYRMHEPAAACFVTKWPGGQPTELLWQIRNFHSFLWASGGLFNDFYIHHVDHLCWMKNTWPIKAQALGGRHYRTTPEGEPFVDQNLDSYSVEYTFEDGTKMYMDGRHMIGCKEIYNSNIHGTKGSAVAADHGDFNGPSRLYKDQARKQLAWRSKQENSPYVNEWADLLSAIRNDKPYNEVDHGVKASLTSSMGRMAAHTGQEITMEDMLNCPHEFAPGVDKLAMDSPSPLTAGKDGRYPVPNPGITKQQEY